MKILILVKNSHPFWSEVELGVKQATQKYNLEYEFFIPSREDVALQISTLETNIAKGVSGIAFAVSNPDRIAPSIKKALEKGIPCITIDTDAPQTGRYLYIGTNNYQAGRIAGYTMSKFFKGKGEIAILTGSLTATNAVERIKGFEEAIGKREDIKIVATICDDEDSVKGFALAQETLRKYPNIKALFGVFAVNGPSLAKAVKSANKVEEIKIVCFDTTKEIIEFIKEDVIHAAIGQRPYLIGYRAVEFLNRMIKQGVEETLKSVPPSRMIDTGVDTVTKDTLSSYEKFLAKLGIKRE